MFLRPEVTEVAGDAEKEWANSRKKAVFGTASSGEALRIEDFKS
jgi:hypothetical protein